MADDVRFEYRLPLTYARITGSRTTTTDELAPSESPTVSCQSVVTMETGADLLSRYAVRISPEASDKQKTTWNLLPDGRLTGADVSTTVDRRAGLKAALSVGSAVLGAAAPLLLPLGPPGWIALGGAALGAAGGAAAGGRYAMALGTPPTGDDDQPAPLDTEMVDTEVAVRPADWDVHERYVVEEPEAAQVLATYRAVLAEASANHRRAAWAAVQASDLPTQQRGEERVATLDRVIRSVSRPATLAETAYATWKASKVTVVTAQYDERLRIDDLPDTQGLEAWLQDTSVQTKAWMRLAKQIRMAVTVELEPIEGNNQQQQHDAEEPISTDDRVRFRQPRPATVTTWKLTMGADVAKERQSVQHVFVAFPGNEAWLTLRPGAKETSAVAVTFDDGGALTKVTTDRTAPALQRAQEVTDLMSAVSTGATTGSSLRETLSPPSLVDQAAEAKAARELGLVPTSKDPLKELKEQLAEQELRTRMKIAEQLASATTAPVMVSVSYPSEG